MMTQEQRKQYIELQVEVQKLKIQNDKLVTALEDTVYMLKRANKAFYYRNKHSIQSIVSLIESNKYTQL